MKRNDDKYLNSLSKIKKKLNKLKLVLKEAGVIEMKPDTSGTYKPQNNPAPNDNPTMNNNTNTANENENNNAFGSTAKKVSHEFNKIKIGVDKFIRENVNIKKTINKAKDIFITTKEKVEEQVKNTKEKINNNPESSEKTVNNKDATINLKSSIIHFFKMLYKFIRTIIAGILALSVSLYFMVKFIIFLATDIFWRILVIIRIILKSGVLKSGILQPLKLAFKFITQLFAAALDVIKTIYIVLLYNQGKGKEMWDLLSKHIKESPETFKVDALKIEKDLKKIKVNMATVNKSIIDGVFAKYDEKVALQEALAGQLVNDVFGKALGFVKKYDIKIPFLKLESMVEHKTFMDQLYEMFSALSKSNYSAVFGAGIIGLGVFLLFTALFVAILGTESSRQYVDQLSSIMSDTSGNFGILTSIFKKGIPFLKAVIGLIFIAPLKALVTSPSIILIIVSGLILMALGYSFIKRHGA